MLCIYSFSGTIAELAADIVPAYIRKNADIMENVNEEIDRNDHDMPREWYDFINK